MGLVCGNCGGDIAVPTKEGFADDYDRYYAECVDCGRHCRIES